MNKRHKLSVVRFLSLGYFITITLGTILLLLPFATKEGETKFIDALFTATSATCVTGLVVFDTATHWTLFGQIVILILIQIGGLGFMTIITLLFMLLKKNIGLYQRTVLMQSAGSYNISGVVSLIKRILIGTLIFEGLGAVILSIAFKKDFSSGDAILRGIFHSVSAFCNAGFDLMGSEGSKFVSLTNYYNNPYVCLTICALIIIGGAGFIVWSDILDNKFRFGDFRLHTKIVIVFTTLILASSTLLFLLFEQKGTLESMNAGEKILSSFFMAVTPRTAGFETIPVTKMTSGSRLLTMILMFIGGCPGSTAGGVKVTTMVVIFSNLFFQARRREHVVLFKRRITSSLIKLSSSLFLAYLTLIVTAALVISFCETKEIGDILFEVVSAIGTVGLSVGVTSQEAHIITKIMLILLMYAGRIGAFTLFGILFKEKKGLFLSNPEGKVLVG